VTFVSALSSLDKLAKLKVFNPLIDVVKVNPVVDGFIQVPKRKVGGERYDKRTWGGDWV
jgi:hypothetical protein